MLKMNDLYTAQYSDGETVREITLDEAYKRRGVRRVTFSPSVIVRRLADFYTVDYDGRGVGCLVSLHLTFVDAKAAAWRYGEMTPQEFAAMLNGETA